MKRQLCTFLLFVFSVAMALAQGPRITYHNKKGQEINDQGEAYFYRIIAKDEQSPTLFKYLEFYSENDGPKLVASLNKGNSTQSKVGICSTFYPNGQLYQKEFYDNKSQLADSAHTYYPNGVLYSTLFYKSPIDAKMPGYKSLEKEDRTEYILVQDSLGNKLVDNGTGTLLVKDVFKADKDFEQGPLENHKRNGKWTGLVRSFTFTESWVNGKLVAGTSSDSLGVAVTYDEKTYGTPPEYPGGINALRSEVANHYKYPQAAIRAGVKGTIQVQFVVDRDGRMVDFKILKDLGHGTAKELIAVLESVRRKWSPGIQRGRAVRVSYTLPMTLNLQ